MRIRVDARVLMDKKYSGISEYTANLLTTLLEIDKTNFYQLFYNSYKPISKRLHFFEAKNSSLLGTRYSNKIFNYFLQKIFAWPKLDKVYNSNDLKEIDIFFAPHLNFISLKKKTKFVLTVHDVSFLRYPEFFSTRKNIWHKLLNVRKLIKRADHIVAVSKNTKADLVELLNINPEKITVIYSGLNYLHSVNHERLNNFDLKPGYFLFLGNIEPRKNISGLIQAYNLYRVKHGNTDERKLVLAGMKGWRYRRIFKTWKESPYKNDIIFLGYIDASQKENLFKNAAAFVYPSFYEGFGFPPLEAMYYNLPVISSNISSLPEVLGEAALLIDPYSSEQISEAMELVINNEALRDMLIKKGQERLKKFTWSQAAQKYLNLFIKIHEGQK